MSSDAVRSGGAPWNMLHPASILVNLLPQAWRVIRSFWPLGLALLWQGGGAEDEATLWVGLLDGAIIGLFFLLTVGGTLRHWLTLRYRIARGRLEIRTGLLSRQVRTIDPGRVQNVELVRTVPHRVSGLVEVRIETASGTEVEGLLSALTVDEAERLRDRLERLAAEARAQAQDERERPDDVLVHNGLRELFVYGATAGRMGAAAVALGLIVEGLTWVSPTTLGEGAGRLFGVQGLALGVAVLAGAWLFGVVTTMVRHWDFSLTRTRRSLVVQGGLTTRRRLELPLRKVQIVLTSEPLLRRWIGIGSLTVETAAARSGEGGTERRAALVPVVDRDRLPALAREAVPDLDVDPWSIELRPPHRRALIRGISRRVLQVLVPVTAAAALLSPWVLVLLVLVLPLSFAAWLDWRHQGWRVTERAVISRRGFFDRRMVVVARRRLQSVSVAQGPLLRRLGLGEVRLKVAGNRVNLPLMAWEEATRVVRELARRLPAASEKLEGEAEPSSSVQPAGP